VFAEARARILASFLARTAIYSTAFFREKYEAQARWNLARSIARLEGARA
jgi:predicted metal-dependent HD superfamily phosphohydrolase